MRIHLAICLVLVFVAACEASTSETQDMIQPNDSVNQDTSSTMTSVLTATVGGQSFQATSFTTVGHSEGSVSNKTATALVGIGDGALIALWFGLPVVTGSAATTAAGLDGFASGSGAIGYFAGTNPLQAADSASYVVGTLNLEEYAADPIWGLTRAKGTFSGSFTTGNGDTVSVENGIFDVSATNAQFN